MPRRSSLACLVLACLGWCCVSCQRSTLPVVGVVPKGANHSFWQTVHAGAIKAGQEYGFQVEWNAPTLETDSSRQIAIVDAMVNRKLAGLVLAPVDRQGLVPVVDRAARNNIPVAIFDSEINTDKRLFFIATDNEASGRLAARRMGELLGGKGKVGVVGFKPGSASTMDRERGFQEELLKQFPDIDLIGIQYNEADRAKALAITENMLAAHPDLGGVFADNESSSVGAAQALKSRNAKNVKLVAYDASEGLIADLRAGVIDSIVVQDPFRMGYEAARAIGRTLRGEKLPEPRVDSGAVLVTRQNIDQPSIQALLYPDIQKYLASGGH